VIVGLTLSVTVTICSSVAVLPEPSVTVQVTVVVPNENAEGASLVTEATEQLSPVTGVPSTTFVEVQATLVVPDVAAGAVIVGLTLSVTVTICSSVAVLPEPSVTVQVTVVVPNGNAEGASLITEATEQLSPVTGVPSTTFVEVQATLVVPDVAAGAVIVGLILSVTVTICSSVAVLPEPSVTVQVTVVVPNGNAEGASLVTEATEQLSPVTGVPSTTFVEVQATLVVPDVAAGAVIVGLTLSVTVTICSSVAVLPEPSVTVQVTVVVPNENAEGASLVTEATEQLSPVYRRAEYNVC
jgi:hypothetical protein